MRNDDDQSRRTPGPLSQAGSQVYAKCSRTDKYKLGWCFIACTANRIDDFDVTYSTRTERIRTKSWEGLDLDPR